MFKARLLELEKALDALIPTTGRTFYVMQTTDAGYEEFVQDHGAYQDGVTKVYNSLADAYNATITDRNDRIYLAAHNHHTVDTMLTIAKNRVHFIGLGTNGAIDMQPEVKLGTLTADAAATIKVTGFGNTFTNIYITNDGTHANSVTALWDAGENTVYTNCQFAKNSDLNEAGVSDVEARGDTTTWRNCKFGVDWSLKTAARTVLLIKGTGASARMKHNIFEDCYFVTCSTTADMTFIKVSSTSSLAFSNIWKNCVFISPVITSLSAVALTDAVASASGLVEGSLMFVNPVSNAANFCSGVTDRVVVAGSDQGADSTTEGAAQIGIAVTPT